MSLGFDRAVSVFNARVRIVLLRRCTVLPRFAYGLAIKILAETRILVGEWKGRI